MYEKDFTRLATDQLGKRYIFGYEVKLDDPSPKAFDCSELVQWLYHKAGADIVDGSANQYRATEQVHGDLKVGDLAFLKNAKGVVHHVMVYVGSGVVVEAKGKLWGVVKTTVAKANARGAIWRRYKKLDLKVYSAAKPTLRRMVVTANVLNVRAGATKRHRVVATLKHGQVVSVGANYNGFLRIEKPKGYASAAYLKEVK